MFWFLNTLIPYCDLQKYRDRPFRSELLVLLANTSFDINISKIYFKDLADYENLLAKTTRGVMKYQHFHKVLVSSNSANKIDYCALYVRGVTEMVNAQV